MFLRLLVGAGYAFARALGLGPAGGAQYAGNQSALTRGEFVEGLRHLLRHLDRSACDGPAPYAGRSPVSLPNSRARTPT